MILNNLRHLFKGHKIGEPNFGDRNLNVSKQSKKSLNSSVEKKVIRKNYKRPSNYTIQKVTKATPKKYIDFTAYLDISKKRHGITNYNKIKYKEHIITNISNESTGSRNKNYLKSELSKSGGSLKSSHSRKKNHVCLLKQKETVERILTKYDFRSNNFSKNCKKSTEYKTPRVEDRVNKVNMSSHKKLDTDPKAKYRSVHKITAKNTSFISKKFSRPKFKKVDERKRSSSSSPDIRTTPNNITMLKKLSENEFGYLNPKRKSYNNNPLKTLYEKKYQLPSKTTAASIKSSALGSGRSSVMSSLTKNPNKYMNNKKGNYSFVETVAKKDYATISNDHIININMKHVPITSINEESYHTQPTRNMPKGVKEDHSEGVYIKDSMMSKKRSMITTPGSNLFNSKIGDKGYSQKYCTVTKKNMTKPIAKKKEKNSSSTRKQPRQILLSGKPKCGATSQLNRRL
jgi:hypothetical protein